MAARRYEISLRVLKRMSRVNAAISLLSVFNQIFERLMCKHPKSVIDKNDMFFKSQYGFGKNYSTALSMQF